ncbi:MAG: hypothetical protein HC833_06875 [Leptolyngbyaceae cyanobacterium RM1_406_9]|nr:hypothetical protein [Leptolyngbyaceae cyanobacterium RM1_406_9]
MGYQSKFAGAIALTIASEITSPPRSKSLTWNANLEALPPAYKARDESLRANGRSPLQEFLEQANHTYIQQRL